MEDVKTDSPKLKYASVIIDRAIDRPLDYLIPEALSSATVGMRVHVPVRGSLCKGTILSLKEDSEVKNPQLLKAVISDQPVLTKDLLQLAVWMSEYYAASLSIIVKSMLPSSLRKNIRQKTQKFIKPLYSQEKMRLLCEELRVSFPQQATVLDALLKHPKGIFLSQLLEMTAISRSAVDTLIKKKILDSRLVTPDESPLADQQYFRTKPKPLNQEQEEALRKIEKTLEENRFQTHLIQGITGSGKTEIYFQAMQYALKQGKSVIFLVPEIALTSQTIERIRARFDDSVALLHHRLSAGQRNTIWQQIYAGKTRIVLGARSAIFSPVTHLGLIIVDEEHDGSFKQSDESPRYHARDVAVMRGKLCQCTVLLGSATPSLESSHNAQRGKYLLSELSKRADRALLPKVEIVDMKKEFAKAKGFTLFSEKLIDALHQRLKLGEQSLLFLNRRGYHTSSLCPYCSHVFECPQCDISLTFHLGDNILACHLCDYRIQPPRVCPNCHQSGELKFKGAGTEMVEKALHALIPEVRTLRLDADTTKHKGSHEKIFKQFRSGKADVLIGTQMIAKGLHIPQVTLVGVLAIDQALNIPDFRASETVFQLLTQVSGRSGRGEIPGQVIIQTHLPDHPIILQAAEQNYQKFYKEEIQVRALFDYPPFSHLVKFIFSGPNLNEVEKKANAFRELLIQKLPPDFSIQPVIACGYTKIKGEHRFQCLIKGKSATPIVKAYRQIEKQFPFSSKLKIFIDVDPQSTYF